MSSIDYRFRDSLGAMNGKTTAVEVAPGVYAERGSGPLGTLDDYTSGFAGVCVDVKQYVDAHPGYGGYTCW